MLILGDADLTSAAGSRYPKSVKTSTARQLAKPAPRRSGKARVLIVDDHPIVSQGLKQLIDAESDLSVCGCADRGDAALKLVASQKPSIVIVDLSLKDMSGIDLIKELNEKHPGLPMLVLSMYDEQLYAERVLRAGARGYVMKEAASDNVVAAIRQVLNGETYLGDRVKSRLLNRLVKSPEPANAKAGPSSPIERLSDRELEVFRLLGQGYSTRRIAERFQRSIKTIEIYRANIKHKLDLKDATELIHYAIRWQSSAS